MKITNIIFDADTKRFKVETFFKGKLCFDKMLFYFKILIGNL